MSPEEFVLKTILIDGGGMLVLLILSLITLGRYIFHHRPLTRQGWAFVILAGGGSVFVLFSVLPRYIEDASLYLRYRDGYVQTSTCKVHSLTWSTMSLVFGDAEVHCVDGSTFYIHHKSKFVRACKEGRTYEIRYLPKSKIVVSLHLIESKVLGLGKKQEYPCPKALNAPVSRMRLLARGTGSLRYLDAAFGAGRERRRVALSDLGNGKPAWCSVWRCPPPTAAWSCAAPTAGLGVF